MKQVPGAVVYFGAQIQRHLISILKLTMGKLLECEWGMEIKTDAKRRNFDRVHIIIHIVIVEFQPLHTVQQCHNLPDYLVSC